MPNLDPVQGKVQITSDTKGVDDAKNALGGFGDSLKNVGEIAAGIGLEKVVEEMVSLTKEALQFSFDTATNFQQTATSIGTLLGSTQEAGDLLKQLSDWEVHTPFTFDQITNSAKQLIAAGEKAGDIKGTLSQLSDISMGDPARLQELVSIWGEVNSQQNVNGRTILRLSSISVPIYKYLGEAVKDMGLASQSGGDLSEAALRKMVEHAQITPAVFNKALELMTTQGGIFYQETQRQSQTVAGMMSSLGSQAQRLALAFMGIGLDGTIDKNGLFAQISASLDALLKFMNAHQAQIWGFFKGLGEAIGTVVGWMLKHKEIIEIVAALMAGVLVASFIVVIASVGTLIGFLIAFVGTTTGVIALIVGGLVAALVWCAMNWESLSATVQGVGLTIKQVAIDIANDVINMVNKVIDAINLLLGNSFVRTGIGLLTGINLPSSIGHIPNIGGGTSSGSSPQLSGAGGLQLQQAIQNTGGVNITNNVTANTPFDLNAFNTKLGLQISGVR